MKIFEIGVLSVTATFALSAATAELSATASDRTCKNYFRGQMHLKGNIAREEASKLAGEFAENKLRRECLEKNGIFSHGIQVHTSCGPFEDGNFHLFEGRVCVTCEATASGDCN